MHWLPQSIFEDLMQHALTLLKNSKGVTNLNAVALPTHFSFTFREFKAPLAKKADLFVSAPYKRSQQKLVGT